MKKKIIILLEVFLVLFSYGCNCNEKSDKELIKQIFGISKSEYTIVNVENTLSKKEYSGKYKVTIHVPVDQMENFISEVEKGHGLAEKDEGLYIFVKNCFGKELSEKDIVYSYLGSKKRKLWTIHGEPKGCESFILYSEAVDNVYEVNMVYFE